MLFYYNFNLQNGKPKLNGCTKRSGRVSIGDTDLEGSSGNVTKVDNRDTVTSIMINVTKNEGVGHNNRVSDSKSCASLCSKSGAYSGDVTSGAMESDPGSNGGGLSDSKFIKVNSVD